MKVVNEVLYPNLLEIEERVQLEADQILSPMELELYRNITNEVRRREFLMGRYAIKKNLLDNLPLGQEKFTNISVEYGSLRFPIIKDELVEVGLSHSKTYVFSMLYSKDNVVGVDMETIRADIPIMEILSASEKEVIAHADSPFTFAYIFFSCKEALGKALKIGLLADYSIYEIESMDTTQILNKDVHHIQFKKFPFLKAYSFMKRETEICSIVVPQKMNVEHVLEVLISA